MPNSTSSASGTTLLAPRDRLLETIDDMLRTFHLATKAKAEIANIAAKLPDKPKLLRKWRKQLSRSQTRALMEVAQQVGSHQLPNFAGGDIVRWDNKDR